MSRPLALVPRGAAGRFALTFGAGALLAFACSDGSTPPSTPPVVSPPALPFPQGFLWAVATSAHQTEGNNTNSDWAAYESTQNVPPAGLAQNAYELYETDAKNAADLHLNAFQLTIEWARIVPKAPASFDAPLGPSDVDAAAVAHYHAVIDSLVAKGMQPMVAVTHFSLPRWVHDPLAYNDATNTYTSSLGGWTNRATNKALAQYAAFLAKEYGDKVKWWLTIDEPLVVLLGSFFSADFPPGINNFNSWSTPIYPGNQTAIDLMKNMVDAHALAYRAMKKERSDLKVSFADNLVVWDGATPSEEDKKARDRVEQAYNFTFLDALTKGEFDTNLVGTGPMESHPEWAGSLDFLGVNYYDRAWALANKGTLPPLDAAPCTPALSIGLRDLLGCPKEPLDEEEGMRIILMKMHERYGLPQLITENGFIDDGPGKSKRLVRTLAKVHEAQAAGANVIGYSYWTLNHDYEWNNGYDEHMGLFSIAGFGDGKKFTFPDGGFSAPDRTTDLTRVPVQPFVDVFRDITTRNGISGELLARYK